MIYIIKSLDSRIVSYALFVSAIANEEKKEPPGHPILGDAPNCKGVPCFFKAIWSLILRIIDINFETTSSKLIPLQFILGFEVSPFFGRIFRFPICQSSIYTLPSKKSDHICINTFIFSSSKALIAFGETPFKPGALCRIFF